MSRWADLGLEESKNMCDDFRPSALLGEGTFGTVWAAVLCRQQSPKGSGESVAVKFINVISLSRQVLATGGYLGRELVVIKLLAANPHANIVRSFGAFYDERFGRESPDAIKVGSKLLTMENSRIAKMVFWQFQWNMLISAFGVGCASVGRT